MKQSLDNWKSEGNEKWGPLRNLPRADAIFKACTILDASEDGISRDGVRDLIGGGSDRDIWPVIKLFQERQSINSKYEFTPDILLELLAKQVDEILENFHSDTESKMEDERSAYGKAIEEISAQIAELETVNDRLSTENVTKNLEIETLKHEITDLDDKNSDLEKQQQDLDNKYKNKLSEIEQLKEKLQDKDQSLITLETKHQDEITRLSNEAKVQRHELMSEQDKERDRLMLVQGNERTTWQSAERKLNKEIGGLNTSLNNIRNELEKKSTSYLSLHKESGYKDNIISEFNKKIEDHNALKDNIVKLTMTNEALSAKNIKLENDILEMSKVSSQLNDLQTQINNLNSNNASKTNKE